MTLQLNPMNIQKKFSLTFFTGKKALFNCNILIFKIYQQDSGPSILAKIPDLGSLKFHWNAGQVRLIFSEFQGLKWNLFDFFPPLEPSSLKKKKMSNIFDFYTMLLVIFSFVFIGIMQQC